MSHDTARDTPETGEAMENRYSPFEPAENRYSPFGGNSKNNSTNNNDNNNNNNRITAAATLPPHSNSSSTNSNNNNNNRITTAAAFPLYATTLARKFDAEFDALSRPIPTYLTRVAMNPTDKGAARNLRSQREELNRFIDEQKRAPGIHRCLALEFYQRLRDRIQLLIDIDNDHAQWSCQLGDMLFILGTIIEAEESPLEDSQDLRNGIGNALAHHQSAYKIRKLLLQNDPKNEALQSAVERSDFAISSLQARLERIPIT